MEFTKNGNIKVSEEQHYPDSFHGLPKWGKFIRNEQKNSENASIAYIFDRNVEISQFFDAAITR